MDYKIKTVLIPIKWRHGDRWGCLKLVLFKLSYRPPAAKVIIFICIVFTHPFATVNELTNALFEKSW